MKNCRNCKHADWFRYPNGRKAYGGYAQCTAPVGMLVLPASRRRTAEDLTYSVSVASYDKEPVDCEMWEKE